jgi:SpoVK/Ycf46/Vps4 family AAA+-type ATPase
MEVVDQIKGKYNALSDQEKELVGKFNPNEIPPQKLDRKWLENLASHLTTTIEEPSKLPVALKEFIAFVDEVIDTASFLQCKDPLTDTGVTFGDIAGQHEAKNALMIGYVYPLQYSNLFKTEAKGFLLYGPPGTGKTLLAKAATGVLGNVAFFNPTPGDIKGKYVGETEKNIKTLFDCAEAILKERPRDFSKAVIFFDEFDSIGGDRSGDDPNMKLSVNALLQEMEGVRVRENVSVLAATNYPESLDPAILRRLTQRIPVDIPDEEARRYILLYNLIKNYTIRIEGESKKDFDKRVREATFNPKEEGAQRFGGQEMFSMIEKHGSQDALSKETATFFKDFKLTTKDPSRLRPSDIDILVKVTGPNPAAQNLKKLIENGTINSLDEARDDGNFNKAAFGYSASDITKMTELAINNAAVQSLMYNYVTTKPGESGVIIAQPKELFLGSGTVKLVQHLRNEEQKARVISFDIRKEHFHQALEQYKSTIKTEDYCRFLFAKR